MSIRVGMRAMARVLGAVDKCPEDVEMVLAVSSACSLCSTPATSMPALVLTSTYSMCVPAEVNLLLSIASTYSLAVAVT